MAPSDLYDFYNDSESSGSDGYIPVPVNSESPPGPDANLPVAAGAGNIIRRPLPSNTNVSRSHMIPTYSGTSYATPSYSVQVPQTTLYDPPGPRMNVPLEDYIKVCNERDQWRVRYTELKASHEMVVEGLAGNIAVISSGFKDFSAQTVTSSVTSTTTSGALKTPSNTSNPPDSPFLFTRQPLPQLDPADYKNVGCWDKQTYDVIRKSGKSEGDEKSSILSCFMEDENGNQVPESEKDAARSTARGFFSLLLEKKRDPPIWGAASLDVVNEFIHILESAHPFLRLCHNHWKSKRIATNSYSQWRPGAKRRFEKAAETKVAHGQVIDVDSNDDKSESESHKRPRAEDNDTKLSKRPRVEETQSTPPPHTQVTVHRQRKKFNVQVTPDVAMIPPTQGDPATPGDKTPPPVAGPSSTSDRLPPAPIDLGLASVNPVAVSLAAGPPHLDPVSPVVSPPAHITAPALQDESQTIPAAQKNTPSLLVAPAVSTPRTTEAAAISVSPESSAGPPASASGSGGDSNEQTDLQHAQDVPPSSGMSKTASTKASGRKKAVKKPPTKKITPRSLGLEDWKKNNPKEDEKKFNYFWKKLPQEQKKSYEERANELNQKESTE